MKRHLIVSLSLMIMLLPLTSHAFDGKRKGFVLGVGGGLSPHTHWSRNVDNVSESKIGGNFQLIVGHGWNSANMLVLQSSISGMESDKLNLDILQGVWAVRWNHYFCKQTDDFGRPGTGWYSTVGVGRSVFSAGLNHFAEVRAVGWGFVVGAGYEFHRHLQFGVEFSAGSGSDDGYDYNHQTITFTLSALAY